MRKSIGTAIRAFTGLPMLVCLFFLLITDFLIDFASCVEKNDYKNYFKDVWCRFVNNCEVLIESNESFGESHE